ncbi:MAG: DNA gyrase subunit A [Leptospiraceae bacterium]|nr:DNA gyrase subunit A [Leptospiraceae bacterium]MDW8307078.1 DNA gyrase subunit A [Leptospiraceae bacterium]
MSKTTQRDLPQVSAKEVIPVEIEDQMKKSYLAYAMSVIIGRALPDVRDGLKPVHRRILHAMNERGWRHDKPYVKSAKIVGEVIGNYHPHGDAAVYETMVRMAQDFAMRVPLIDGQGNFGSIDGDPPAAYRYTEARLSEMAEALLEDIDKETVDFVSNFDDTRKEPTVLPAAFPNLLVNGSSGIAVGMATKIPPHNLNEVIAALDLLIEKPDATIKELMKKLPGPDFPTGGIILGREGLKQAYTTGKGTIKIRAVANIEEIGRGRQAIVVTQIPYEVKKNELITRVAELVNEKKIEGITDIRDESDRSGMRIVFELKKEAQAQVVLNQLYQHTQMQVNYGIIFLALVDQEPKLLNLKELLQHYLNHRRQVVVRRTQYDLRKAQERAHILEGLKIALDFIDEVIRIIRASLDTEKARHDLMERFKLTEIQANAILDMRLQKLTSLESKKILEELAETKNLIVSLEDLLSSEAKILGQIRKELNALAEKAATKRQTEISDQDSQSFSFATEDLIADTEEVITLTEGGYIRRVALDTFRRQHRGGKGIQASGKKEDAMRHILFCRSHDYVMFFSTKGKVFFIKAYEIPEATKDARGKSIRSFLSLTQEENITCLRAIREFKENLYLFLLTHRGIIKKLSLLEVAHAKKGGLMAMQFKASEKDYLVDVAVVEGEEEVFLATRFGLGLRTGLAKMRAQGRSAGGILGMSLEENDAMIGFAVIGKSTPYLICVSENGYAKRVSFSEFATKGRGGKGMQYFKVSEKSGPLACVHAVGEKEEIIVTTEQGMVLRSEVSAVPVQSRVAGGVRLVELSQNDKVVDTTVFVADNSKNTT